MSEPWKAPGEVKHVDSRPRDQKKEAVRVDERIADSRHVQRWTAGDPGRERFDTKETLEMDIARAQQDTANEKLHVQFDLSAHDNHMKSERFSFSVVGHGSDQYRENYSKIDWSA